MKIPSTSRANASPSAGLRPAMATRAPSAANARTAAAPIPLAPPVMMMLLPCSCKSMRGAFRAIAFGARAKS